MADASSPAPEFRVVDIASCAPEGTLVLDRTNPRDTARRFLEEHYTGDLGRTLIFDAEHDRFREWTGAKYDVRDAGDVREEVASFIEGALVRHRKQADKPIYLPFKPRPKDVSDTVTELRSQLHHSGGAPAWTPPDAELPPADEMVAFDNGLLHLPTKAWCEPDTRFFCRSALNFRYSEAPPVGLNGWLGFLQSLWPDDMQSIDTLQEIFGLSLTRDTSFQKAFLIVGPRRSGKGTIARILRQIVGEDDVAAPTLGDFSTQFGLAPLTGRRLAIVSDARLSGKADQAAIVEKILSVTGEDKITIDRKHRDPVETKLNTRFVITTNELPALKDTSGAFASRFIVLNIGQSFLGRENPRLYEDLAAELPAIFHWSLEGLERLQERGRFIQPQSAAALLEDFEDLGSPVSAFIKDQCALDPSASIPKAALFQRYRHWCEQKGLRGASSNHFARDLHAANIPGFDTKRTREGDRQVPHFCGITMERF
ncbi:MAG: phage/plasmid primase, P4 family [Pseudomonadota bacterium]